MPPAALAAIGCFAAHEVDPAASAEGAYLGRLAAAALLAVAALAPAPAAELGLGAALAAAAVWALPAGPGRGAVVLALLAAALAVATARRLRPPASRAAAAAGARNEPAGATPRVTKDDRGRLAVAVALCFGWQVLLRGELLFAPGRAVRPWLALLVLPAAAGAGLALLWRRRGPVPALAAAATAAVLAPGWTVATTLAMVALAGGELLGGTLATTRSGEMLSGRGQAPAERSTEMPAQLAAERPAETLARMPGEMPAAWPAGLGSRRGAGARLAAGVVALLLPLAWEPRAGWAAALAGLALWRPGLAAGAALPLAALVRGAALAGWRLPGALGAHGSWREGALAVAWLLMLVPAALPAAWRPRARRLLAAAALLAFAAPWLPDRSALAAPLALAALALPATGAAAGLAAVWSAAALLGTALLASYPWLRQDPLGDAFALLGAGAAGSRLAAAIGGGALLLVGLVGFVRLAHRRSPHRAGPSSGLARPAAAGPDANQDALAIGDSSTAARAARLAAAATGAALFVALAGPQVASPGSTLLGAGDTVLLDRSNPSWQVDLGPWRSGCVWLQTTMIHAATLAGGTPVARVRLLGTGTPPAELVVRAGEETGEWAARRPDVAASARLRSPRPWLVWVAGDAFGQRYRARLPLPRSGSFARLRIDLAPGLPPDTGLAVYQVELAP